MGCTGWGCIIAKRGAKGVEDFEPIQRIEDLFAVEPEPKKICRVIRRVAAELKGNPATNYERLRSKRRRLEKQGQLPKPASPAERVAEKMKESFRLRISSIEEARRSLPAAEEKARSLGVEPGENLPLQLDSMRREILGLDGILSLDPEQQMRFRRSLGIADPDEAARSLILDEQRYRLLLRQLEALGEVSRLRFVALQIP